MIKLTYAEIKEDIKDTFESLYHRSNYTGKDTFYVILDDHQRHNLGDQSEECCIYVNCALILLQNKQDIGFMKNRLSDLIQESHFYLYRREMTGDFQRLKTDIEILKKMDGSTFLHPKM